MELSVSLGIAWQLAAFETIRSEHELIEPEHFMLALMKISEMSIRDLKEIVQEDKRASEFSNCVMYLHGEFNRMGVDTHTARPKIRAALGKGSAKHDGRMLHRSSRSREMFRHAVEILSIEQEDALDARHILDVLCAEPTRIIEGLLSKTEKLQTQESKVTIRPVELDIESETNKLPASPVVESILRLIEFSKKPVILLMENEDLDFNLAEILIQESMICVKSSQVFRKKTVFKIDSSHMSNEELASLTIDDLGINIETNNVSGKIIYIINNEDRSFTSLLESMVVSEDAGCRDKVIISISKEKYGELLKVNPQYRAFTECIHVSNKSQKTVEA